NGQDVMQLEADAKAQFRLRSIGFVFQQHHLIRGLNACENVSLPLILRGESTVTAAVAAKTWLARVGLETKVTSHPAEMSIGQCQRVALSRALVGGPQLILADEPTASLDADTGREAIELISHLTKQAGTTAIIVTHDQRILGYADRVILMGH